LHRAEKAPVYNRYVRLAADPGYNRANDGNVAIFRPLLVTGFLIDDFLTENGFFGARSVVLSSASSKTALGLAFLLSEHRENRCTIVGLTAPRNLDFVKKTGYYDHALPYEELNTLQRYSPIALIDFAGNGDIVEQLHHHLSDSLRYSASVGISHWNKVSSPKDLPGPAPEFFSAPACARKRMAEWGATEFQSRTSEAMRRFTGSVATWFRVIERSGQNEIQAVYQAVIEGKANPAEGYLLSLHSAA
jgi:hypothetical protein